MILLNRKLSHLILLSYFTATTSFASTASDSFWNMWSNTRGVVSVLGGWSWTTNSSDSYIYSGDDEDLFEYNYIHPNNAHAEGYIGGFIGGEWVLMCDPYLLGQLGVEYDYFGSTNLNGYNNVGIGLGDDTFTPYNFGYKVQTQQVLVAGKLLITLKEIVHPYVSAAIGAAFNRTSDYVATTTQQGSINITPTFGGLTQTQFAYRFGLGVDTDISNHLRLGIGYQYNGVGKASTKRGVVTFNGYKAAVPFSLNSPNIYANQLLLSLSYVG